MGFLSEGKKVEKRFAKLFNNVEFSSESDDINKHFDLTIKYKVDVKSLKKVLRTDDGPNENVHWVELVNVNGDKGWLYGEADFFAFELEEYWVIVSREKLIKLIERKLVNKETIIPIKYHLYSRKNRKDKLTLVKTLDLIYISECILRKK